jgi:hypothetical protein
MSARARSDDARYAVRRGAAGLDGFVIWDWTQQTFVAFSNGVALRWTSLADADRFAEQLNLTEVTGVSRLARFQSEAGEKSTFADYLNGDWEPSTHKPNLPDNWVSETARLCVQDVQGGAR